VVECQGFESLIRDQKMDFVRIDNIIDAAIADYIEKEVYAIPYVYNSSTVYGQWDKNPDAYNDQYVQEAGQFVHYAFHSGRKTSDILDILTHPLDAMSANTGLRVAALVRVKINFTWARPDFDPNHYNQPHKDDRSGLRSMVYYINQSTGPTVLFNEYHEDGGTPSELTEFARIHPKKNSAVLFDSDRYHASSNSTHGIRIVANYIFEVV
jgi:hypothetical protein